MTIRDNKRSVHILDRSEALSLLGITKEQDEDFQSKCKKGINTPKLKVNKIKPNQKQGFQVDAILLSRMDDMESKLDDISGVNDLEKLAELEIKVNKILKFLGI